MNYLLAIIFVLLLQCDLTAQVSLSEGQVQLMEHRYQMCLDSGQNMLGCTIKFYKEMDSCISLVYEQLMQNLDSANKKELRSDEIKWLKQKEKKFKSIDLNNEMEGRDGEMAKLDAKATFLKERVMTLIKKISKY